MAACGRIRWRHCRARNLKPCSTALKRSCRKWEGRFFPARRRWIRIVKAMKHRVNFVITGPCAGLIHGRTSIAYCVRRRRRPSIIHAFHSADKSPLPPVIQPRLLVRSNSGALATGSVLICHRARIVLNPQRPDGSEKLRVGTAHAPAFDLKFKLKHDPGNFTPLRFSPVGYKLLE